MKFFTFWGSGTAMTIITSVIIIAFRSRRNYSFFSWAIGLNLITSSLLNKLFKGIFHRQRPDIYRLVDITGFSFPSGHSMVSICFYGFIVYLLWVKVQSTWKYPLIILLILLVLCIGTSRIYLGVHYASDVLGGFSIGLAWLTVYISIIKKLNYRFAKEKTI
jgi:undecaprenyl-diphosphatase